MIQLAKYEEKIKNMTEDKEMKIKMQGWYNFV